VVLAGCGQDELAGIAEQLCRAVAEEAFLTSIGPVALTVSIGGVSAPPFPKDARLMLAAVEWALYEAKRQGKNRVVITDAYPPTLR
jgi:GGDEF domain-containing protein